MAMELRNNHAWFGVASQYRYHCEKDGESEMGIRPIRVLLVEDNPADQLLAKEIILAAHPDSQITVIDDGEKAIYAVEHWSKSDVPDIIFLDLNLPRINGHEVLDRIKQTDLKVPVIVLTGSTSEKDIERARRHNILDYIIKPIGMRELEETITRVKSFIVPRCS